MTSQHVGLGRGLSSSGVVLMLNDACLRQCLSYVIIRIAEASRSASLVLRAKECSQEWTGMLLYGALCVFCDWHVAAELYVARH